MEDISEWQQIEPYDNYLQLQSSSSSTHHEGSQQISSASTSASEEESEISTPAVAPLDETTEAKKLFEAMRAEVIKVASKVRDCAICAGASWSITHVAGAAAATAVLVSLVCVGIGRRRRKVEGLGYLLTQKDEEISQLLLQIANLNESLSSRHKVPVYRISR